MSNSKLTLRDLDWVLLNRKQFIGTFIVQLTCGPAYDRVQDVAQITEIYANDFMFTMKCDGNCWMLYNWDNAILPVVTEDETNVIIEDKILEIRYIILKKDKPK